MPQQSFHPSDEPTQLSISLLVRSLEVDSAMRGVNSKNYAHRSRVIRQQTELLAKKAATVAPEDNQQSARIMREASRAPDHREEGGEG